MRSCLFCEIVSRQKPAEIVFEDQTALAFLDHRPLFPGHVLLVPKAHTETLADLPASDLPGFFSTVQKIELAVETAMDAEGSFIAINNKVSQSVPHLHVHIVPRNKGDGLKGFFWPRKPYDSEAALHETADKLRRAIEQ
jgi:histidine triad (HIT) family protein